METDLDVALEHTRFTGRILDAAGKLASAIRNDRQVAALTGLDDRDDRAVLAELLLRAAAQYHEEGVAELGALLPDPNPDGED